MYNYTLITKKLSLLLFGVMFSVAAFAQIDSSKNYSTDTTTVKIKQAKLVGEKITGTIVDGATNKPLVGVKLTVVDFSGALTDEKGKFTITSLQQRMLSGILFLLRGRGNFSG